MWKTPTPPENIRTQKLGLCSFLVPDILQSGVTGGLTCYRGAERLSPKKCFGGCLGKCRPEEGAWEGAREGAREGAWKGARAWEGARDLLG